MKLQTVMRFFVLLLLLLGTAGGTVYHRLYIANWLSTPAVNGDDKSASEASPSDIDSVQGSVNQAANKAVSANANRPTPGINRRVAKTDLYPFLEEMLSKLPSGTRLDAARFDQVLGSDAGNYLRTANVARIEVTGDLFVVTMTAASTTSLNGQADLKVAQKVTFRYQKDFGIKRSKLQGNPTIHFSAIDGVEVKVSWVLGWMPVSQLDFSRDTTGNTVIVVTVNTLFGKTNRTFVIGPHGKPRTP